MAIEEKLIIELQAKLDKYMKDVKSAGTVTEQSQKQIETSLNKVTQAVRKANDNSQNLSKGFGSVGKNAGQAGIQVQQFVGQLQGGQSVFVALSQQAADLGIVLGAPLVGAFVSIGAVIAGTLLPSLFDAREGFESLADSVVENTDKLKGLGEAQRQAVSLELTKRLEDELKIFNEINQEIQDVTESIEDYQNLDFGSATGVLDLLGDKYAELTGKEREAKEELITLEGQLERSGSAIFKIREILDGLKNGFTESNAEVKKLTESLALQQKIFDEAAKGAYIGPGMNDEGIQQAFENQERLIAAETLAYERQRELLGENHQAIETLTTIHFENLAAIRAKFDKKVEGYEKRQTNNKKVEEATRLNIARQSTRAGFAINQALFDNNKDINAGLIVADTAAAAIAAVKNTGGNPLAALPVIALGIAQLANNNNSQPGAGSISSGGGGSTATQATQPQEAPPTIGVSVSDVSGDDISSQTIIIATEDGETIFEGIAKKTKQLERDGVV